MVAIESTISSLASSTSTFSLEQSFTLVNLGERTPAIITQTNSKIELLRTEEGQQLCLKH
jgi:hypothetical protein